MANQPPQKEHPPKVNQHQRSSSPPAGSAEDGRTGSRWLLLGAAALLTCVVLIVIAVASWGFFRDYSVSVVIQPRGIEPTPIAAMQVVDEKPLPSTPTALATPTVVKAAPTHTPTPEPNLPPTVNPSPTADPIAVQFEDVQRLLAEGRTQRDVGVLNEARDKLDDLETSDAGIISEMQSLRKQIDYALDGLSGTIYLDDANTMRLTMLTEQGLPLVNPIDMTFSQEGFYVIDSGTLYRTEIPQMPLVNGDSLLMTTVITPTEEIDGFPVKELVAVEASNIENGIYVLDKSNDIYFFSFESEQWVVQRSQATENSRPDPHFLNISGYNDTLYLLDPSRNQIWRHPSNQAGIAYLPSNLPWAINPGEPDVTHDVAMAIDGYIYTLSRDGIIIKYLYEEVDHFSLNGADGRSHISELESLPISPKDIYVDVEDGPLYIADAGRRRVIAVDRENGAFLRQYAAPDNSDFSHLHAVTEQDGYLFILAGTNLYSIFVSEDITQPVTLDGELPQYQPSLIGGDVRLADLSPNDPRVPQLLASHAMTMPLDGALLPDRFVMYPGARRAYRYGVHRGIDFYEADIGVEVQTGTPVLAAAGGVVVRADVDYQEMGAAEVQALLTEAAADYITSEDTLDKLGGRQVWIEHDGFLTKYEHLSSVAEGIVIGQAMEKGQVIGYVGSSGTPDKIYGNSPLPHLHFEIRFGEGYQYYLGQWLTVEDTRRAIEQIFAVPVYVEKDDPTSQVLPQDQTSDEAGGQGT